MFAGPDWHKTPIFGIPDRNLIQTTSQILFVLGRTEVYDSSGSLEAVYAIQDQYQLQTLSSYQNQSPVASLPLELPKIPRNDIKNVEFFIYLNLCLSWQNPPDTDTDKALMQEFAKIDVGPDKIFDRKNFSDDILEAMNQGIKAGYAQFEGLEGNIQNGWKMPDVDMPYFGTTLSDYDFRAVMASVGLYVNTPVEAVYPMGILDDNNALLNADNGQAYRLTFSVGERPPASYFWSVTMYDVVTKLLVANPLDRYSVGRQIISGYDPEAPLTIEMRYIEDEDVQLPEAIPDPNEAILLPAPKGAFYVVLRIYGPDASVLENSYEVPSINPVS